jgi:hypothetical protein
MINTDPSLSTSVGLWSALGTDSYRDSKRFAALTSEL